jgi:hypothetical protein
MFNKLEFRVRTEVRDVLRVPGNEVVYGKDFVAFFNESIT